MTPALREQAAALIDAFAVKNCMIATAESCTGGLIAATLTSVNGSSRVVDRGFVTYTNEAKAEMLGVDTSLIDQHGAVSEPVARAMAEGALSRSKAFATVSVTGIAGPGGGSETKPVGLVHFGCASKTGETIHRREVFTGDRDAVRDQTVRVAFEMLRHLIQARSNPGD